MLIIQVKLSLMRTMQKILVQFNFLKQLQHPQLDTKITNSTINPKIRKMFIKKRQLKQNSKVIDR